MKFLNYDIKKKESFVAWYLLAIIAGFIIFGLFLGFFNLTIIIGSFMFQHYVWFIVGIFGFFFLKKLLINKKKTIVIEK